MGMSLWIVAGGAAWIIARFIPPGRTAAAEAIAALVIAMIAGLAATALDFGGWNEPDWRAGVFVFLCVAAALGVVRLAALRSAR
jgi:hypothetical protein